MFDELCERRLSVFVKRGERPLLTELRRAAFGTVVHVAPSMAHGIEMPTFALQEPDEARIQFAWNQRQSNLDAMALGESKQAAKRAGNLASVVVAHPDRRDDAAVCPKIEFPTDIFPDRFINHGVFEARRPAVF